MGDYSLVIDNGSGGTITFDNSTNATRLKDRLLSQDVNYSAKLVFSLENRRSSGSVNLLNSSCALWSSGGPMALARGMVVQYSVDPTDFSTGLPGSLTQYFEGVITNLEQGDDGVLNVTARDYLYFYEGLYSNRVSYASYRDRYSRELGIISSGEYAYKLAIESVDSDGYYPGVRIEMLTDDYFFDYGLDIEDGGAGHATLGEGYAWAQAFVAEDEEILGVLLRGKYARNASATTDSVLRVSIRDDDGADRPSTSNLFYKDVTLALSSLLTADASSGQPVVYVADTAPFNPGMSVTISDDAPASESATISSIDESTGALTMTANLSNSYTTANNAKVSTTSAQYYWVYFDDTDHTFERLISGRKYWVHIEHYSTDVSNPSTWQQYIDTTSTYTNTETDAHFVYGSVPLYSGSSEGPGSVIAFPYLAKVVIVPSTKYRYYLDGATPKLVITDLPSGYPGLDTEYSIFTDPPSSTDRGRVSYYYGTIDVKDALDDILDQETVNNLSFSTNADISLTLPLYKTMGRSMGNCIRELVDLYAYDNSGTWNQSAVFADVAGYDIRAGRRKNVSDDAAVVTFMHGASTSTDNYRRIMSATLRKTTDEVPGVIRVTGRSDDGSSIIVERDSRGLGSSSYISTVGYKNYKLISDPSITTLDDANRRAWTELEKYNTSSFEGSITVSGVYPHLINRTTGSGEIISITHPQYGLVSALFAVTGVEVGKNQTVIHVSNTNYMRRNFIIENNKSTQRTEAFNSDQDDLTYRYVYVYKSATTADTSVYMQLCQSDNTILDSHSNYTAHRVACTILEQPDGKTDYNTKIFRAEFEPENGYGTVERIELYTDYTGGSQIAEFDFNIDGTSSALEFLKTKYTKVVVEFAINVT